MKHFLIVVDMQTDFVNGALGTSEAQAILPGVCEKIKDFDGNVIVTLDTHEENYMETREGKYLPVPHCIKGTDGHKLCPEVKAALDGRKKQYRTVEKPTFGAADLPIFLWEDANGEPFTVEFIGVCTDICVISNAMLVKAAFPEADIFCDAALCAGVTPEAHRAALTVMKSCQIDVKNF